MRRKSTSSSRGRSLGGGAAAERYAAEWPVSAIPFDLLGRDAVAATLDVLAREVDPRAATFFVVGADGHIQSSVVQGSPPGAGELPAPDEIEPAPARVTTLDDRGGGQRAIVPIRVGARPVAGVTAWPAPDEEVWSEDGLRRLAALQPLIELAYLSTRPAHARIEAQLPESLTERQRQVAHLLAGGATNPEIARALYISPDTAKSHTRAVLAKLGLASRRELVMRSTEAPGTVSPAAPAAASGRPPQRRHDARGSSVRLDGDATPQRLMAAVLDWSAERIDAVLGGCAIFSARLELVAQAWGSVRSGRRRADPRLAGQVHRRVVSPGQPSEVVRYLDADPARSPVVQLDVAGPARSDGQLGELLARVGLAPPLLTVLHSHGRVAAVIWLCRDAEAALDQRDGARALQDVHRLLELTHVARAPDRAEGASRAVELDELGLTPRERAVARLALEGASNAAIARRLSISESTVKKHMTRVLSKSGVRSRTQLIAMLSDADIH